MYFSWLVTILAIALVLTLIVILLRLTTKHRKKKAHRRLSIWRARDHGAHIARKHGHERSPEWQHIAKEHRKREPACVACGYKGSKVQVHRIKPFHLHPQLELDPDNLITLCSARGREHHLLLGHLDSWESYNEHIRADAKHFHRKTAAQIRADVAWLKKLAHRP